MARAQASKLLDQLLGHNRDGEDKQVLDFLDIAVCRPFLFGICPNEMFLNTKMDMGELSSILLNLNCCLVRW